MKNFLLLIIFTISGCVLPGSIPKTYQQPTEYLNQPTPTQVHVYAPSASANRLNGLEILVDGQLGPELKNGEVSVKVNPGYHTIGFGTYLPSGGGYVMIVNHIKVTPPIFIYVDLGETNFIRYKPSPGSPLLQQSNKQIYDVELALFQGLKTYDEVQKTYVEETCNPDTAKVQNSKTSTPLNSCESESSFDSHVQAIEEVHSNLFEWDVWAKAANETVDDPNTKLMKYIELRSNQLYAERTGEAFDASLYKQALSESESGGLSGIYRSSFTSTKTTKSPHLVFITQSGNKVTGVFYPDNGDRISGTIDSNSIKFLWTQPESSYVREGSWNLNSDGTKLESYMHTEGDGKWVLTKFDSTSEINLNQQAAPLTPNTPIDISGTYIADITSNQNNFFGNIDDKLVFTLEQNGGHITAVNSTHDLKIGGTRKGNLIEFFVEPHHMNYYQDQNGVWEINSDGINIKGSWKLKNWGVAGQWNLRRIE